MRGRMSSLDGGGKGRGGGKGAEAPPDLAEAHAASAGLKGLCTMLAVDGLEDLRKCCGGVRFLSFVFSLSLTHTQPFVPTCHTSHSFLYYSPRTFYSFPLARPGLGYLNASGIGGFEANFKWLVTADGDWVVMLLQTARYLYKSLAAARERKPLSAFAQCLAPLGELPHDAQSANQRLRPPEPASALELESPEPLLAWFEYRAAVQVATVGAKLDSRVANGEAFDGAWNLCAPQLLRAATSHCHAFILHQALAMARAATDRPCAAVLARLAAYLALAEMVGDGGWQGRD